MIGYQSVEKSSVAVIFAGGRGTRLWPLSTDTSPKQLDNDFTGHIPLEDTFNRVRTLFPIERIFLATRKSLYPKIQKIVSLPKEQIIFEPENSETAIEMGLVALHVQAVYPGAIVVTIFSDQVISHVQLYKKAIKDGIAIVSKYSTVLCLGTMPYFPNIQLGYIGIGKKLPEKNLFHIARFLEKPEYKKAIRLVKSKKYLWNTGLYIWNVEDLLQQMRSVAPSIYTQLLTVSRENIHESPHWHNTAFQASFEKSIIEKMKDCFVYKADYDWIDIGNWKAIYDLAKKDEHGIAKIHAEKTKLITINSQNCLVIPRQKTVSLVGVKDLLIVQDGENLLICHKDYATLVKQITDIVGRKKKN